jgi:hypothetical protein
MHCTALLLGDFDDQGEPVVGVFLGIGEWDAQRALVNVPVVQVSNEGILSPT